MTMASAEPIQREHSPGGGVQGLRMKPPKRSIGRCASRCIVPVAWQLKSPSKLLHFFIVDNRVANYKLIAPLFYRII